MFPPMPQRCGQAADVSRPANAAASQVALIQCAQAMGIQRYVFFSIHNCDRHPEVPLMLIKSCTEKYLETSGLNFTTFRMCGFMQVCCLRVVFMPSLQVHVMHERIQHS